MIKSKKGIVDIMGERDVIFAELQMIIYSFLDAGVSFDEIQKLCNVANVYYETSAKSKTKPEWLKKECCKCSKETKNE